MPTLTVEPAIDLNRYWKGLAKQDVKFPHALAELIDNSLSARLGNAHGSGLQTTLIEICITKKNRGYEIVVVDPGQGMSLDVIQNQIFNPGGQGNIGVMNEHGFGLKNALALLTDATENFTLLSRDQDNIDGADKFFKVEGPLSTCMNLSKEGTRAEWENSVDRLKTATTGTKLTIGVLDEYFESIYNRPCNFDTYITRLGEHLGVMYRSYLRDGNDIFIRWTDERSGSTTWQEKQVVPIEIPYEGSTTRNENINITVDGATYTFNYTTGVLDYDVKDPTAESTLGWPYPLKIYYQGSSARCGVDITVRGRVILNYQFESIWPNTTKGIGFNRFVGELQFGPEISTTNNKTALDPKSPIFNEIKRKLNEAAYLPQERTRSLSEDLARTQLQSFLEGAHGTTNVHKEFGTWGSHCSIDLKVDETSPGKTTLYELKITPAKILNLYQLVAYWDGLVEDGKVPDKGILVCESFPTIVMTAVSKINSQSDQNGNSYNILTKKWTDFGITLP